MGNCTPVYYIFPTHIIVQPITPDMRKIVISRKHTLAATTCFFTYHQCFHRYLQGRSLLNFTRYSTIPVTSRQPGIPALILDKLLNRYMPASSGCSERFTNGERLAFQSLQTVVSRSANCPLCKVGQNRLCLE